MLTYKDEAFLNQSLRIMRILYTTLRDIPTQEAKKGFEQLDKDERKRYSRKDGKDTIKFDVIAEKIITSQYEGIAGHNVFFREIFEIPGISITEEQGRYPNDRKINQNTPVIISDPVDRSSYLERILEKFESECTTMGEVFDREREEIGEEHARVEACNASLTLLKDGDIKYSLVLNLFTGEIFIGEPSGIYCGNIMEIKKRDEFKEQPEFKTEETLNLLCYNNGSKYQSNFKGTHLRLFNPVDIQSPGGPNRFTYLLQEPEGKITSDVGLIAHNGEKVQEILPNIAMAYFSQGRLAAYKLFCDREHASC